MKTTAPSILNIGIEGMSCGHCVAQITKAIGAVPGVEIKSVALGSAKLAVPDEATATAALVAIQEAGYPARIAQTTPAAHHGCCGGAHPRQDARPAGGSYCG